MNPVLETLSLTKRFRDVPALDGLTLSLEPGHIFGLLGRNGSGKTTLLQHVVGLLLPTRGECRTLGIPASRLGANELEQIGYVPQSPRFLRDLTVAHHLNYLGRFYPAWDPDRQARLLSELELSGQVLVGNLSGGDLQKFASIAAVCHHPKLLILDEPFSALDPIVRERMLTLLVELAREDESTIVVSSHILHDVEKVIDWVVCLDSGRLLLSEPLDQLQEHYAEWTVTARGKPLPSGFSEPYIVSWRGDAQRVCLRVKAAAGQEDVFAARHEAEVTIRPLNLEQLFPLLVGVEETMP